MYGSDTSPICQFTSTFHKISYSGGREEHTVAHLTSKHEEGVVNAGTDKVSPPVEDAPETPRDPVVLDDLWTEVCQFEPAQESVYSYLSSKDGFKTSSEFIDMVQSNVEERMLKEMNDLLQQVVGTLEKLEEHCLDLEYDIEYYIMANHERRSENLKRVERSAERAQSLFARLLSGLYQSMH